MYYIMLEICIGGQFLEDCSCGCSQQIIFVLDEETLIPYNLIQRAS